MSLAVGLRDNLASGWVEGAAVLVAVLLVGVVTAANNFSVQVRPLSSLFISHLLVQSAV